MNSEIKTKLENIYKHKYPFKLLHSNWIDKSMFGSRSYYEDHYNYIEMKLEKGIRMQNFLVGFKPFVEYLKSLNNLNTKEGFTYVESYFCTEIETGWMNVRRNFYDILKSDTNFHDYKKSPDEIFRITIFNKHYFEKIEEPEPEGSQNITVKGIKLFFKNSIIVKNNSDNEADFRIDNYKIDHLIPYDIVYYEFFNIIRYHITEHIFKIAPFDNKPVKYIIFLGKFDNKYMCYEKNKRILPDLEIYFQNTIGKTKPIFEEEVNHAIYLQQHENYNFIHTEDGFETLTIIQERLTFPYYYKEPNENQIKLAKTFKEDNCVVCITNKPDILFCNCGHLCICEECFSRLDNKNNCLKCRERNTIIRKI